jgi:hypothetical protein
METSNASASELETFQPRSTQSCDQYLLAVLADHNLDLCLLSRCNSRNTSNDELVFGTLGRFDDLWIGGVRPCPAQAFHWSIRSSWDDESSSGVEVVSPVRVIGYDCGCLGGGKSVHSVQFALIIARRLPLH